ncbi:MAG TPA: isoprenyl transferase [Syntrophales bacterium]|nr:isoprenyl transferase [Syntrophales bacterium]
MKKIDYQKLPQHIAIIMDGNGRWAEKHAFGRITGHKRGTKAVKLTVRACREIGIKYLTLYAFSVENWLRPKDEVEALMDLLGKYLRSELKEMIDHDIRLTAIGNINALEGTVREILMETMNNTAHNKGMVLNLALSYGGRDEIIEAVKGILEDNRNGKITRQDMTKDLFSKYLYTADIPDPDLLIRTSGEYRLSNFLLWQTAYTEFYFTDVLWPDFRRKHLMDAIADFQSRERRFGLTSDQLQRNGSDIG